MMKFDMLFRNGLDYQRNDLISYFIREFEKAERDNFHTVETFFPPLYERIKKHQKNIEKNLEKRKLALEHRLQKAKKNELDFAGHYYSKFLDKQGINYEDFKEEQNKIIVKDSQKEMQNLTAESVISQPLFGFKLSEIKLLEENLKEAEKKFRPIKDKVKIPLKNFFTDKASPVIILEIQKAFKDLKKGKEMAILIYLLHKKYELIFLDNNQRNNKSRIYFVRALTGTEVKTIKGINNFFEPITAETTVNEKDEVFLKINKQLKEMVSTG